MRVHTGWSGAETIEHDGVFSGSSCSMEVSPEQSPEGILCVQWKNDLYMPDGLAYVLEASPE